VAGGAPQRRVVNGARPAGAVPPFPFVVGCDRSGTTLVRAILDSHPEMAVPPESYFPARLLLDRRLYERPAGVDGAAMLAAIESHPYFQSWDLPADAARDALAGAPDVPGAIRALYACYAAREGKARFGDKTPKFVFAIDLLAGALPEAVFVHVVRDGRDVALSRADAGWRLARIGSEAMRWRAHVEHGRARGQALGPGRYHEIRYEDLVAGPEAAVQALCGFLALDYEPAMLRYHERARAVVAGVQHRGLHENIARPPTSGLRNWGRGMDLTDARVYTATAGRTLRAFGYPTRLRIGPRNRLRALAGWARWRAARGDRRLRERFETGEG
jgi:hypothetical protein